MLEVRHLRIEYGRAVAVEEASLTVAPGEIVALIGANGAGKSSILRGIAGIVRPARGSVTWRGHRLDGLASDRVLAQGIAFVPEGRMILGRMSVRENLLLGAYAGGDAGEMARVLTLFPDLAPRLDEAGSALSGGQAQMLALARGLMARPKLLLLDEPSLGLSPRWTEDVFALIARLKGEGLAILLVEQNLHQALAVADRAHLLESGRIVREGPARLLAADPYLREAYLGLEKEPPA